VRIETLFDAAEEVEFGGKAAGLSAALRAGLEVPPGLALDVDVVDALATSKTASDVCASIVERLGGGPLAVRSSAVGEDSEIASFAGQHLTRLNVRGSEELLWAIREVWASGRSESAIGYRRRLGLDDAPRIGIVVQRMIAADRAGVLFTRNPMTGADERIIEASWGLGEAVVAGIITPDRWTMRRDGEVIEAIAGEKDVEVVPHETGVIERPVDPERVYELCLDAADLAGLQELADACEAFFGEPSDIEFAFEADQLYLLQRRAVTR
jgi:pyruvate, water dikinase